MGRKSDYPLLNGEVSVRFSLDGVHADVQYRPEDCPFWQCVVVILVAHSDDRAIIDFFASCKQLCALGRTLIAVVHSYAFDDRMLIRVRSLCDAHLILKMEQVGERLVKILEVAKVRNADQSTGNVISFDVEPGMGMKIIPISKAKA